MNHPFTGPREEDLERLESDPGSVRARAYDVVVNGWELGSGSIRIHRADLQERVFRVLGISAEEGRERFGFLLEALRYGAPPHGGIALGLDRICAIAAGATSLRDVIAFPKTTSGIDLMTKAPADVLPGQLAELGLGAAPPVGRVSAPAPPERIAVGDGGTTIWVGEGLLADAARYLVSPSGRFLLVSAAPAREAAGAVRRALGETAILDLAIEDGEADKTLSTVERIADAALSAGAAARRRLRRRRRRSVHATSSGSRPRFSCAASPGTPCRRRPRAWRTRRSAARPP